MKNKGWMRILEAFIAAIIVLSFLVFLYSKTIGNPYKQESIYNFQKAILEEIASNQTLRDYALTSNIEKLKEFAEKRMLNGFNFTINICRMEDYCGMGRYNENVYSSRRVIASSLGDFNPKKVVIFMWRE